MPFTTETRANLLVCCADAPSRADRITAHRLLRDELRARLDASGFDHSHDPDNRAFGGIEGGPGAARWFYMHDTRPGGRLAFASATAITPAQYAAELAALEVEAATLIAHEIATTGDARLVARRRWLRGGWATGHTAFALHFLVDSPTTAAVTLAAGTYRIEFTGQGWSHDPTPGATVAFDIAVDNMTQAYVAETRASGIGDDPVTFDVQEYITLASTGVLTLVAASDWDERLAGILRIVDPGDS